VYTSDMNRLTSYFLLGVLMVLSACKPAADRQSAVSAVRSTSDAPVTSSKVSGMLTPVSGGDPVDLFQLPGQATVLVFFAPWSDSAAATLAWMTSASLPGVELVPVVLDRAGSSPVPEIDGHVVYRADEDLAAGLGVRALPTAVRIEAGRVAARWAGLPSFTGITATAISPVPGS